MVPLMYRRTHYTASQWPLSGSCMYLLIIKTTCDKSGLVHTIAYIKLPTALVYDTRVMYSQFSTVAGDIVAFNLKWGSNDVLTDFVSPLMLNLWSTFFKYSFYVKLTLSSFGLAQSPCLAPSFLHQDPSSRTRKTSLSSIYLLQICF